MTDHTHTYSLIEKARVRLAMERPFYRVLLQNVEPVITTSVPTAATDTKKHYWNPDFIESLTQDELLGVQAHENEHDARHHSTRRGNRDPYEWNVACDYAINPDLIAEGFTLPEDRLLDPKYAGMAAEDIYRSRELDKAREQQQQQQEDNDDDADADTNPGSQSPEQEDSDVAQNDDEQDATDSDGDEDSEQGSEHGDSEGSEDAGKGAGEGEGDEATDTAPGAGTGTGEAGDEAGDEPGKGSGAGNGKPGSEPADFGSCGQVLDAPADDANEIAEQDIQWEKIVSLAANTAKAAGKLPGHVSRDIERAHNPPRDWRDELREFCEQGALRRDTWDRPNRRFAHSGMILPGNQRDGVNKAAILIDTSGSCDAIALACVQDEMQTLMDDGIVNEVVVVYGDVRVTRTDSYITGDEIEFDPKGGGGTDMQPLFEHVAEEVSDASLAICFTDLEFYKSCGDEPHCPVLFAVHGYPQRVKQLMEKTPWDARAIDVGSH